MSNILILAGSPRRNGNTDLLVRAFSEGAASGGSRTETIQARDLDISPCCGCNSCVSSAGHRCRIHDDMEKVYDALMRNDALAVASPLYFYGISAQLKAVTDRLHTPRRDSFGIRKTALLISGASTRPGMFDAVLKQYELIISYFGLEDMGKVLASGVKDIGDINSSSAAEEAYRLGASFNKNT